MTYKESSYAPYDFANRRVVSVETPGSTNNWDVALASPSGAFQLVPAVAFAGVDSRARIGVISGTDFDSLEEAPRDTTSRVAVGTGSRNSHGQDTRLRWRGGFLEGKMQRGSGMGAQAQVSPLINSRSVQSPPPTTLSAERRRERGPERVLDETVHGH